MGPLSQLGVEFQCTFGAADGVLSLLFLLKKCLMKRNTLGCIMLATIEVNLGTNRCFVEEDGKLKLTPFALENADPAELKNIEASIEDIVDCFKRNKVIFRWADSLPVFEREWAEDPAYERIAASA